MIECKIALSTIYPTPPEVSFLDVLVIGVILIVRGVVNDKKEENSGPNVFNDAFGIFAMVQFFSSSKIHCS
jgi:hypothetical protein